MDISSVAVACLVGFFGQIEGLLNFGAREHLCGLELLITQSGYVWIFCEEFALGFEGLHECSAGLDAFEGNFGGEREALGSPIWVVGVTLKEQAVVGLSEPSTVLPGGLATGCCGVEGFPWHGDEWGYAVGTRV